MKKIVSLLLSVLLAFSITGSVFAQNSNTTTETQVKSIFFNGHEKNADKAYVIEKDKKRYLPLRPVFEAMGYEVSWNNEYQSVMVDRYGVQIIFELNSNVIYAGGQELEGVGIPVKINDRVYMEYNALVETLGIDITWDSKSSKLLIFQKNSNGFFWKVEHEDNVVYLLGSVHVGESSMYPIRDVVEKAFHESDYAVFEIKIDEAPSEEENNAIIKLQTYQDGTTLKNHIPATTYNKLQTILKAKEIPLDYFDEIKPWYLSQYARQLIETQRDYEAVYGIDNYFVGRAILEEKPILGLETYLSQFQSLSSYSDEYMLNSIESILNVALKQVNGEEVTIYETDGTGFLIDLWKQADANILEELIASMPKEEYDNLLVNRHGNMLQKIEGFLNSEGDEDYFVTVGYLHTLGNDGLVKLLADKGYKIVSYQ